MTMTKGNLSRRTVVKRLAGGVAALALALCVGACGGTGTNDSAQEGQEAAVTVTVEIDASAADVEAVTEEVGLNEGATAYDALVAAADDVNANETEYGMYVMGINGVAEGDAGERSCWMYYVNGEMAEVGCSEYEVASGDVVTWTYVQDWNEL